jgi:hypothetical protein
MHSTGNQISLHDKSQSGGKKDLNVATTGLNVEIGCLLLGQPQIVAGVDINAALCAHLYEGNPCNRNKITKFCWFVFYEIF